MLGSDFASRIGGRSFAQLEDSREGQRHTPNRTYCFGSKFKLYYNSFMPPAGHNFIHKTSLDERGTTSSLGNHRRLGLLLGQG